MKFGSFLICIMLFFMISGSHAVSGAHKLASAEEAHQALLAFRSWTTAYQKRKYITQWNLTHRLIRQYSEKRRWAKIMRKSKIKNGELLDYKITAFKAIPSEKVPCTERGHCYRKNMQVVMILVQGTYEKLPSQAVEYVVMANSSAGWKFGGGTFLNRPTGETMTILDRKDQSYYKPRLGIK